MNNPIITQPDSESYEAPAIEIISIAVENGIAESGTEGFGEDGEGEW